MQTHELIHSDDDGHGVTQETHRIQFNLQWTVGKHFFGFVKLHSILFMDIILTAMQYVSLNILKNVDKLWKLSSSLI